MNDIIYGYCYCGCGQKTRIATVSDSRRGHIKGFHHKYIHGHNRRINHPLWNGGRTINTRGYVEVKCIGHPRANQRGYVREHILICEKALGKPLPPGAEPHHIDGNKQNNEHSNLVLCQDRTYHKLIEKRRRVYLAALGDKP